MRLFCNKYITFYVDIILYTYTKSEWETFIWQNLSFTYIAMFLLTLYHHGDGYVHSIVKA